MRFADLLNMRRVAVDGFACAPESAGPASPFFRKEPILQPEEVLNGGPRPRMEPAEAHGEFS